MISVVCSSRHNLEEFKNHIVKKSGLHNKLEFLGYENNGEFSLTEIYNRGLKEAKNDVIVFMHDDVSIETNNWAQKILKLFDRNQEFGVIGVAGTKYLAQSGKWWEDPKKMYGRVMHTHDGRSWLSEYSADLGQIIEPTIIVDGLFFAIDKRKIKKTFDENVKGFHFYDLNFCLDNYLEEVKIGVTTIIRVNHKSIGMTNEQWEENRIQFAEKFKGHLPQSIKRSIRKGEKLNIIFSSMSFDDNSDKAKFMLEVALKLKKAGHNITICANLGGKISIMAKQLGLKLAPIQMPPNFALGDGKWKIKTPQGEFLTQPNVLYKIKNEKFDIVHLFDNEIVEHFSKLYADSTLINTRFTNNLFLSQEDNPLTKKTIEMENSEEYLNRMNVDEIIREYIESI
jgi:hypothetical protein